MVERFQRIAFACKIERVPVGHAGIKFKVTRDLSVIVKAGFDVLAEKKQETAQLVAKVRALLAPKRVIKGNGHGEGKVTVSVPRSPVQPLESRS